MVFCRHLLKKNIVHSNGGTKQQTSSSAPFQFDKPFELPQQEQSVVPAVINSEQGRQNFVADNAISQEPQTNGIDEIDRISSALENVKNTQFKSYLEKQNTPQAKEMLDLMQKKDAEWANKSPMLRMEERYNAVGGKDAYLKRENEISAINAKRDKEIKDQVKQEDKYVNFDSDIAKNTAQYLRGGGYQLAGSISKTLSDGASGILNMFRDAGGLAGAGLPKLYDENGQLSPYAQNLKYGDVLGDLILKLDGVSDVSQSALDNETLPNTTTGKITTNIARIAPDVAAMVFAPETKVVEGANLLTKAKNLVWNPFTKYMMAKGGLTGYAEEKKAGGDGFDATLKAVEGSAKGAVTGATVGVLGGIAGNFSKTLSNDLVRAGVIGIDNHLTKAGIRALSEAITFGGAPIVESYAKSAITGNEVNRQELNDEVLNGIAMGAVFGAKSGVAEYGKSKAEYATYRNLVDNVLPKMQENAFASFLRADTQTIGKVATEVSEPGDLHAKGIELIAKSEKEPVEAKRNEMLANAALNIKLADIKGVTEVIVNNRQELVDYINESNITPEAKGLAIKKVNEVHDLLSETGEVKRIESNKVEDAVAKNEVLSEQLANATTPEEIATIKAQAEQNGKQGIDASQNLNENAKVEVAKENDVSDVDFINFQKNGIVDENLVAKITEKVRTKQPLTPREEAIFYNDKTTPTETTSAKELEIGDEVPIPDMEGVNGFVKEFLPNNKAVVAVVEDGQYREQTIDLPKKAANEQTTTEVQGDAQPAAVVGKQNPIVPEPKAQSATGEETLQSKAADSGTTSTTLSKPKNSTRTSRELGREPASFNDAVNQFYLGGNKLSTEDFITHTGFGFVKDVDGKKTKLTPEETKEYLTKGKLDSGVTVKMTDELRKAKFTGKVADRSNGGIDADMILSGYVPEQFAGEQGMDLVTEIVNTAANKTKGQILKELESTNSENKLPNAVDNFGYSPEEVAEMEALDMANTNLALELTDKEIKDLEDYPAISEHINAKFDDIILSEKALEDISSLLSDYTNSDGSINWEGFQNFYTENKDGFNTGFFDNDITLKTIFEYGSATAKQQLEQKARSNSGIKETSNSPILENDTRGKTDTGKSTSGEQEKVNETVSPTDTSSDGKIQSGTEQSSQQGEDNSVQSTADTKTVEGKAKIEKAQKSVDAKQSEVVKIQNEVAKLSEKLAKNLKENQSNLFGENKTQSLFDDKADQQKIFNDKIAELKEAQESLVKAKTDLAALKETEGQVDLELPESKVEIDGKEVDLAKTTTDEDGQIIFQNTLNPFKIISGITKAIDRLEHNTTTKWAEKAGDVVAETLKDWRNSKSAVKQRISSFSTAWFGGIARTSNDIDMKLGLIGGKNMAIHNMGKVMKLMYEMIDYNTQSLERIDVVLDPDWYQSVMAGQSKTPVSPSVKSETSKVYDANDSYSKIGSKEDYAEYVASVFPDSKVNEVVFHGTTESLIPKDGKFKGFVTYFSTDKNYSETFGFPVDRKVVSAVVNVKNPYNAKSELADVPQEIHDKGEFTNARIIKSNNTNNYDAVIGTDAGQKNGKTIVIFDGEQIHLLGSKVDEKGFENFVKNKTQSPTQNVPPNLTYADLSPKEQMLFDEIRKILDHVHFKNYALGFIDIDTFKKHEGTYTPRMYETHELPDDVEPVFKDFVKRTGDKLNLNGFKKRKDGTELSDETKADKLKDPVYAMAKRMMELDTNSAIMTYINYIARNNKKMVYDGPEKDKPFNYVKLDGKAYGSLNGKYVPNYIAEDLRGYHFVNKVLNATYDLFKIYDRSLPVSFIKKKLTVYNPAVQLGNNTINFAFAWMAGIDVPRWVAGLPYAFKEVKSKGDNYEKLLKAGVLGVDVAAIDFKPKTESMSLLSQNNQPKNGWQTIRKAVNKADEAIVSAYSMSDDVAKMNAFLIFMKAGYNEKEAIKKVRDSFQNYATVGKMWDVAAKTPIFGNKFIKFKADLMRIMGNNMSKKPLSTSLFFGMLAALPAALLYYGANDETDEERELRETRPFTPKIGLGFYDIPLSYKIGDTEINGARYTSPVYGFDTAEDSSGWSMLKSFFPYRFQNRNLGEKGNFFTAPVGQDPYLGTLFNAMIDTDFRGKSIQDPNAGTYRASGISETDKKLNQLAYVARNWAPYGDLTQDAYLNYKYGEDYYGRSRDLSTTIANFFLKMQTIEKESGYYKIADQQIKAFRYSILTAVGVRNGIFKNLSKDLWDAKKDLDGKIINKRQYQNRIDKLNTDAKEGADRQLKNIRDAQKKLSEFTTRFPKYSQPKPKK